MSLYIGNVTRATSQGVWVTIPNLPGVELGPLLAGTTAFRIAPLTTSSAGSPSHTHTVAQFDDIADRYAVGQPVLVAEVTSGEFVVVCVLTLGVNS